MSSPSRTASSRAPRSCPGERGVAVVEELELDGERIVHEAGTLDLVIPSCAACKDWVRAKGRFEVNDLTPRKVTM